MAVTRLAVAAALSSAPPSSRRRRVSLPSCRPLPAASSSRASKALHAAAPAADAVDEVAPASPPSDPGRGVENLVIIGSGPAGYTAAIYAARANLKPVVFEGYQVGGVPGGQLMTTTEVENFPGFPDGITGPDLMDKMRKQAERWGAELHQEDVEFVNVKSSPFVIRSSDREMKNQSDSSSCRSGERSPFKDLTNTTTDGAANPTANDHLQHKRHSGRGWYARMSNENKVDYLKKQRIARQQKKTAVLNVSYVEEPQSSSLLGSVERTPLNDVTNTHINGATCRASNPTSSDHQLPENKQKCKRPSGQEWYA